MMLDKFQSYRNRIVKGKISETENSIKGLSHIGNYLRKIWDNFLNNNRLQNYPQEKNPITKHIFNQNRKNLEDTLYVGIDESGWLDSSSGVVYTAVFSSYLEDASINSKCFGKRRKSLHPDLNFLEGRNYSYLFVLRKDMAKTSFKDLPGLVAGNLIRGEISENFSSLNVFIDGEMPDSEKNKEIAYSENKKIISELCNFKEEKIKLIFLPQLDKKSKLVNNADLLARMIWIGDSPGSFYGTTKSSFKNLFYQDGKRKEFLVPTDKEFIYKKFVS